MTAHTNISGAASDWLLSDTVAPDALGDPLQPLYDGAALRAVTVPFCGTCQLALELEQQRCDGCGSANVVWRQVDSVGTVHSATVMHRRERGLVLADEPYPIVDVELLSGHRIIVTTVTPCSTPPPIGTRVTLSFRQLGTTAIPAIEYSEGSS